MLMLSHLSPAFIFDVETFHLSDKQHHYSPRAMSTPTLTPEAAIPDLDTVYSGVPTRLANEAVAAKSRLDSQRTVEESSVRKAVSLPPGIGKDEFDRAIKELKSSLGAENVEINDKPLIDGWYMQHP